MNDNATAPPADTPRRPSVLAPVVILCLFVGLLPTRLVGGPDEVSNEECLTLADVASTASPAAADRLARLEQCTARHPEDVELLAELGVSYEAVDRERAERVYAEVLSRDPDHADVRLRLAHIFFARGAFTEATRHAELALRIQPNRAALVALRERATIAAGGAGR